MVKSELEQRLARRFESLKLQDVRMALDLMLGAMSKTLANQERIEIRGFGSFMINHRPARRGRNPKNGQQVMVPPKVVPHFKPGLELRQRVNIVPEAAEVERLVA
ncbi:integration host factor subunit beta [Methylobacillus sp.]|uniref:integration host factor subunit beta n=1 Tax=Methylobacillus sp. TaxID=56818 RepID=UPI002FE0E49C